MRNLKHILTLCALIAFCAAKAQRNSAYERYIEQYRDAAIEQMHKHNIPASITLAQALIESGAGTSYLATRANNHFGIKVGMNWKGDYVKRDDDKKNEKFRKYKRVQDSYEDHSEFLKQNRYQRLFALDPLDYKAWARGLKACGYATLPTYAERLIRIIETYELDQYDEDKHGNRRKKKHKEEEKPVIAEKHQLNEVNGISCVTARRGDTWEALAKETGVRKKKLLAFNEADEDFALAPGTNVFLAKKATKADSKYKDYWHKVKQGESMYTISQFYGIRLKNLYKMNFKDDSYIPVAGDLLKVR